MSWLVVIGLILAAAAILAAFIQNATERAIRGVEVVCPLDGQRTHVNLDPKRAVGVLFFNKEQRVVNCDRWLEQAACGAACAKRIGA